MSCSANMIVADLLESSVCTRPASEPSLAFVNLTARRNRSRLNKSSPNSRIGDNSVVRSTHKIMIDQLANATLTVLVQDCKSIRTARGALPPGTGDEECNSKAIIRCLGKFSRHCASCRSFKARLTGARKRPFSKTFRGFYNSFGRRIARTMAFVRLVGLTL